MVASASHGESLGSKVVPRSARSSKVSKSCQATYCVTVLALEGATQSGQKDGGTMIVVPIDLEESKEHYNDLLMIYGCHHDTSRGDTHQPTPV